MISKEIDGFEGYFISENGTVQSFRSPNGRGLLKSTPKTLLQSTDSNGYKKVGLYKNGILHRNCKVHTLVAKAFIPNPLSLPEVNHKNGVKTDNNLTNLEWCSKKENMAHSRKVLRKCTGDNHGRAKLTKEDVILICGSGKNHKELSQILNVHVSTVQRIARNNGWKHDKVSEWVSLT